MMAEESWGERTVSGTAKVIIVLVVLVVVLYVLTEVLGLRIRFH